MNYKNWKVSKPILKKGTANAFDNVAVKDPSIVFYNGKYHVFYTSKKTEQSENGIEYGVGCGYVAAESLEKIADAKRYNLSEILDANIIAPQVFYFKPQKLWYMFAHRPNRGKKPNLIPIYLTNPDINNPNEWSKSQDLHTGKSNDDFWIDFWVICDDEKAHLFYSDQKGSVLRMECPLDNFPKGFAKSKEKITLTVTGENKTGEWIMFEAEHVFYAKKQNLYIIQLECGYEVPTLKVSDPAHAGGNKGGCKHFGDARNRFMIGMVADKLEGPWRRVENSENEFFAEAKNLFNEDGTKSKYSQVSHPEFIRSGCDQKLEIEDLDNVKILFQSFDSSDTPDTYDYNELPWELAIMGNE